MASDRELADWISAYMTFTQNTEPPKSYHKWIAVSLIAGALQRKVRMVWGHETIYPNLYVILVGPSGKCRKGTAMTIGTNILKEIGVTLTSESITREALIRKMGDSPKSFQDTTNGAIKYHHSLTCFSEELSVFLGQNDTKFLADLTNWYDSRDEWTYETKGSGKDSIQGVCFNFLGATAQDWIPTMFPQEAVGGGFTSRCFFIVEEDKDKTVPLHTLSAAEIELQGALVRDLERIHNMAGIVRFDPETTELYVNWYREQDKRSRSGHPAVGDPTFRGLCGQASNSYSKAKYDNDG